MQLNPYLNFDGQCETAFKFYERCLRGEILLMWAHKDYPTASEVPSTWQHKILHARLRVGDKLLMGGDELPEDYVKPTGFHVMLGIEDPVEADRVFNALADGGNVRMPLQRTFWAARFGMLDDRFGIPWMVNCETGA